MTLNEAIQHLCVMAEVEYYGDREAVVVVREEIERLRAIEAAARNLSDAASQNVGTLARHGHASHAFRAAGDQWHAAYSELQSALAAEAAGGEGNV